METHCSGLNPENLPNFATFAARFATGALDSKPE